MAELTAWLKQNGARISLNDEKATIEKARSMGWKPEDEEPEKKELKGLSAADLKEIFNSIDGEEYPGNKESAIKRLEELDYQL